MPPGVGGTAPGVAGSWSAGAAPPPFDDDDDDDDEAAAGAPTPGVETLVRWAGVACPLGTAVAVPELPPLVARLPWLATEPLRDEGVKKSNGLRWSDAFGVVWSGALLTPPKNLSMGAGRRAAEGATRGRVGGGGSELTR